MYENLPGARHPVRHAELSVCHRGPACCTVAAGRGPRPSRPAPPAEAPEASLPPRPRRPRPPNKSAHQHQGEASWKKTQAPAVPASNSRPLPSGGNIFGWTADEPTSHKLLDAFVDAGFTFVDTADVYSRWAPGHKGRRIGGGDRQLAEEGSERKRDKVLIATKCGMDMPNEGQGPCRARTSRSRSMPR